MVWSESGMKKIGILLSGSGTTFENICVHIDKGELSAEIAVVVSSRRDAYGLKRAERRSISSDVVSSSEFLNPEFSREITRILKDYSVDIVVMAGFMCFYDIPPEFEYKVLNVHPALLPAFGGQGMYGEHVHRAVLEYGAKITGCTVHFVHGEYDSGPVIMQAPVAVAEDDTPESLAHRVQEMERTLYPKAIDLACTGRLRVQGRRTFITEENSE